MKLNVLFRMVLVLLSLVLACGFVPTRIHSHDTLVRPCTPQRRRQRGRNDGMRQWSWTQSCGGGYQTSFSMALLSSASPIQRTEESAKQISTDKLWSRLEEASKKVREFSSTGGFFTKKQLDQQDPRILKLLEAKAGVSFETPKTFAGLIHNYLTKGGGGFIVFSMLVTFLYRMSLVSAYPLGFGDILCAIGTRVFWEAQEWLIHSRLFHGGDDFRAHSLFKSHDRHHDLPYHHVSVEPLRMVVVWWACILGPLTLSVIFLGVPQSIASTFFFFYKFSAFFYSFAHMMCHSKLRFKGRMKWARESHIKHHMSPAHHFNMGPNNFDRLMKTDSYDTRLRHQKVH